MQKSLTTAYIQAQNNQKSGYKDKKNDSIEKRCGYSWLIPLFSFILCSNILSPIVIS